MLEHRLRRVVEQRRDDQERERAGAADPRRPDPVQEDAAFGDAEHRGDGTARQGVGPERHARRGQGLEVEHLFLGRGAGRRQQEHDGGDRPSHEPATCTAYPVSGVRSMLSGPATWMTSGFRGVVVSSTATVALSSPPNTLTSTTRSRSPSGYV